MYNDVEYMIYRHMRYKDMRYKYISSKNIMVMRCGSGQFPLDSHDCYFLLTSCKIINAIDDSHHKITPQKNFIVMHFTSILFLSF